MHGHRREHALAAEQDADAELRPLLGRRVRDGAAVEPDDAARRRAEPGDDAQDRRLAGAVGAEQREHLALPHLEADVEEHLHRTVGEVDVGHLERRDLGRRFLLAPVLVHLLPQLGDDEGQVVADEARAAQDQERRR